MGEDGAVERQCKERSSSRVQGRAEGPCEPSRLTRDGSYASQPLARGKTRKERLHTQDRTPPSLLVRSGLIAKLGDAGTGEGEPSEETWQFMGYYEGSKQGRTLKAHRDNQTAGSEKAPLREASPPPTLLVRFLEADPGEMLRHLWKKPEPASRTPKLHS